MVSSSLLVFTQLFSNSTLLRVLSPFCSLKCHKLFHFCVGAFGLSPWLPCFGQSSTCTALPMHSLTRSSPSCCSLPLFCVSVGPRLLLQSSVCLLFYIAFVSFVPGG